MQARRETYYDDALVRCRKRVVPWNPNFGNPNFGNPNFGNLLSVLNHMLLQSIRGMRARRETYYDDAHLAAQAPSRHAYLHRCIFDDQLIIT